MTFQTNIPSLDLADFKSNNKEIKDRFIKNLGEAYENIGFAAIKNHGIDDNTIDLLYSKVKGFFALADEIKSQYEIEGLAGQRGYTSFGKEHAKDSDAGDLKEFWQHGQHSQKGFELYHYPENVFVNEVAGFNEIIEKAYSQLETSGKVILSSLALYLGLNENYFDDFVNHGNSILRAIYYGPITEEPKNAVRAGQHEDINLITLLVGASADGLQVLNKQNEWVSVTALPDHIVVNVGDMLQRLTNGTLKSTTHRVVNPPKEKWHTPRYSIPFFLHPISSMPLNCLTECISSENPKRFEDITAGEYLDQRLREIGLKH